MITIHLHGKLKKHGDSFKFRVPIIPDALRLLFTQLKDLEADIRAGKFTLKHDDEYVNADDLDSLKDKAGVLHILPVVGGRKGVGRVIAGAALIGLSFWNPIAAIGWASSAMFAGGIALALSGAASLFMKPQSFDASTQDEGTGQSTAFGNLANGIAHNTVYPICFGTFYCGSKRLSQGIMSERNNPNQEPDIPVGQMVEMKRHYYRGKAARDPKGNLYPTDFNNDSVKAQNYKII